MQSKNKSNVSEIFGKIFRRQIFIPIAALVLLAVFNLIMDPSFFKITLGYNNAGHPVLSGYLPPESAGTENREAALWSGERAGR